MSRLAVIEIHKEELKFSAGHFMIFANGTRESLHGHDYQVHAAFYTQIKHNGMAFDCRAYKLKLLSLCQKLDYRVILPSQSDYLTIESDEHRHVTRIGNETLTFLINDGVILPICNATLEELSNWFLQQLIQEQAQLASDSIQGIVIKVFNGRGESGASSWGSVYIS